MSKIKQNNPKSKPKRTKTFLLRLTEAERSTAEKIAHQTGLSLSELFRHATLKHRLRRKITAVTIETYTELSRIGNNLNQIAKAINSSQLMRTSLESQTLIQLNHELHQLKAILSQIQTEILSPH